MRSVGKVIVLAFLLDAIYQFVAFRSFHLEGALYAALILAFLPYLIIRGTLERHAELNWWVTRTKRCGQSPTSGVSRLVYGMVISIQQTALIFPANLARSRNRGKLMLGSSDLTFERHLRKSPLESHQVNTARQSAKRLQTLGIESVIAMFRQLSDNVSRR